jgi:hypothetical protein
MDWVTLALVLASNALALRIGASFGRSFPSGTLKRAVRELWQLRRRWSA